MIRECKCLFWNLSELESKWILLKIKIRKDL